MECSWIGEGCTGEWLDVGRESRFERRVARLGEELGVLLEDLEVFCEGNRVAHEESGLLCGCRDDGR